MSEFLRVAKPVTSSASSNALASSPVHSAREGSAQPGVARNYTQFNSFMWYLSDLRNVNHARVDFRQTWLRRGEARLAQSAIRPATRCDPRRSGVDPHQMRICHVIEPSSGGSGRIVAGLLRDQVAAGHDVSLIYSPLRADSQFTDAVAEVGPSLRVRAVDMARAVGPGDVISTWRLWRALNDFGPFDIIHSHSSKAGALTRIAGLFFKKTAIVYTPHAFVTLAPEASRLYGVVEWMASWFCDAIILGSEQEHQHALKALHLPAARLRVIPMGVDVNFVSDRTTARGALRLSQDAYIVGFVGRLAAQKNPARLAQVFGLLAIARPDLRFVVVGDGEMADIFAAELRAQQVDDRTTIVTDADGRGMMAAFDCLVCTSDYESFGLIFPEALAAGTPIVTPPVGVAEQAVVPGETGVLTRFDPTDIAGGVLQIAAMSPETRQRMAQQCRERARLFDLAETASRTRALYEELVSRKKGALA